MCACAHSIRKSLSIPESSWHSLSPGPYYYQRCGTSVSSPARKFEVSENSARELTLISTDNLQLQTSYRLALLKDLKASKFFARTEGLIMTAWSHAVHGVSFEDVGDRIMT